MNTNNPHDQRADSHTAGAPHDFEHPTAAAAPAGPRTLRRNRRRVLVSTTALLAVGAFGGLLGGHLVAEDEPQRDAREPSPAPTSADECDSMWSRIRALGLPRESLTSIATALGFTARDMWASADGLTWEHLDGRVVVVAQPRSPSDQGASLIAEARYDSDAPPQRATSCR